MQSTANASLHASAILPVEGAVLDGLSNVGGADSVLAFEVGDGAGQFEDAVIGAGAEA